VRADVVPVHVETTAPKKKRIPISKKLDGGNCECCVPGMNNVPCPSYSHDSQLLLQRTRAISESKLS
jgi:hypothetical protein